MIERNLLAVLRRPLDQITNNEEGLRVAVGLTTANADVTVLLLDGAACLATLPNAVSEEQQGIHLYWETLADLGVRRLVERESLSEMGLDPEAVADGVTLVSRADVPGLLALGDPVLVY
ncbi:MAG: DsrE family protein [Chloroflexi bacterium]|nr:DsrE family protein [Chloroflexota bacterium]MCL5108892.1 DsrE family protein [Chloroflexota bacterium]